jgi:hypothetical protein
MFARWAAGIAAVTLAFSWVVFQPADLFFYGDTWDIFRDFTERGLATAALLHNEHFVPLAHLLLLAQFRLFGMEALGYHVTSLLLHAAAAILLYRLTGWFTRSNAARVTGTLVFSCSGTYWEVLQHEVVQQFILALLFTLAAAVLTLEYLDRKRSRWLAAAAICTLAAGLCTSLGLLAGPLCLLLAAGRSRSLLRITAAMLLAMSAYVLLRSAFAVRPGLGLSLEWNTLAARLPWVIPFLRQNLWEGAPRTSLAGPLLLALLCAPAALARQWRGLLYPAGLVIAPFVIVALGRAGEADLSMAAVSRYQYFPMAGIGLFTAWALGPMAASQRWLAAAAFLALIVQAWTGYSFTRNQSPRAEWGRRGKDFFVSGVMTSARPPAGMFEVHADLILPESCYAQWSPVWSLYSVLRAGGWPVDANRPLLFSYITLKELRAMDQLAARHPGLALDQWDQKDGARALWFDQAGQEVRVELPGRSSKYRFTLGKVARPRVPYSFSANVHRRGGESLAVLQICFVDAAGSDIECAKSVRIERREPQILLMAGFPPPETETVTMGLGLYEDRGSPAVIDLKWPLAVEHPVYLPAALRK